MVYKTKKSILKLEIKFVIGGSLLPKIERKTHEVENDMEEDIELKSGRFRIYFQNRYTLISLLNDLLVGLVYILGSISSLIGLPSIYGTYFYLAGGVFLILRPLIKIIHNIYIYKDAEERREEERKEKEQEQKEQKENEGGDQESHQEDQEYNQEYYGDDHNKEYEKEEESGS